MSNVIALITSKQFITSVVTLLVNVLVAAAPGLEGTREALILSITAVAALVIAGVSYTDGKAEDARATLQAGEMTASAIRASAQAQGYVQQSVTTPPPMPAERYMDQRAAYAQALHAMNDALTPEGDVEVDIPKLRKNVKELLINHARYI